MLGGGCGVRYPFFFIIILGSAVTRQREWCSSLSGSLRAWGWGVGKELTISSVKMEENNEWVKRVLFTENEACVLVL